MEPSFQPYIFCHSFSFLKFISYLTCVNTSVPGARRGQKKVSPRTGGTNHVIHHVGARS